MGTNYYAKDKRNIPCMHENLIEENDGYCWDCYNNGYETIHIGKSSYGWTFSWHSIPELNLCTSIEWFEYLKDAEIYNEYGERVDFKELKELIETKASNPKNKNHTVYCRNDKDQWTRNHGIRDCYLDPFGHSFSTSEFS